VSPSDTFIGLLRGINLGSHNKVPMAELRALCEALGWSGVRTYIQSGNVVFRTEDAIEEAALETLLEDAVGERFGFRVPVLVRRAAAWRVLSASNPFPEASRETPNLVMAALSRSAPPPGILRTLRERTTDRERVELAGGALWIRYDGGVRNSRISPGLLDRLVGSPVTTRNWRTVLKLEALAAESPSA
jgi:uncharacterized protein (DUF1697 family)